MVGALDAAAAADYGSDRQRAPPPLSIATVPSDAPPPRGSQALSLDFLQVLTDDAKKRLADEVICSHIFR